MQTKYITCICFTLFILLFVSCGGKGAMDDLYDEPYERSDEASIVTAFDELEPSTEPSGHELFPRYHDVDSSEMEEIRMKCQDIARLCNKRMINGESEESIYFPYDKVLTQSAVDDVEILLIEAGYPVLNRDSKYPEYLENSASFKQFLELIEKGEDARQSIINVSPNNCIYYITFQYADDTLYCTNTVLTWSEDGNYTISDPYKMETLDWGITNNEYFYYQLYPLDRHWNACSFIRLEPINKELYDLYAEYLTPIGYPSSVFTIDWDKSNYDNICFNDLFEALYRERYDDRISTDNYEYDSDMHCFLIPAEIFENTILPYFEIPFDEFRASAFYMHESNTYPWQTLNGSNIIYCPTLTPEVVERRDNEDGTFTIVVDVLCFDYKCFPLFTHEITIRPYDDGGFQYVSNRVTYVSDRGVPATTSRLEAQRK